ncbi:MAG: DUF1385 domain-containing protein [Lachnospiraceae bacterium]
MEKKSSGIGGQAVLEGIMMKNKNKYAVAVRKPDKEIEIDVKEYKGIAGKSKILNLPFIRGIFSFVDSLVLGIKTLTYSAEFFDEEIETAEDKTVDKVAKSAFKEKAESFLMGITVFVSIVLSVALFIVLPYYVSEFFKWIMSINSNALLAVIEGIARILIFVLYLVLISRMKDIQRTFMYHGAEHKCINCIENGYELNIDNVRISSRQHRRCGTSFLLFVMVISVIAYILVSALMPSDVTRLVKVGVRLLLVPLIAGIAYEIIRLAGRSDNLFVRILSAPGLLMQRLTTKEPDDDMIEVGIRAVEAVFDWREYQRNMGIDSALSEGAMEE